MESINVKAEDLKRLINDVAQIKEMLISEREEREMEEIELTDWAKNELKKSRETPEKEYISHEEVKKRIFAK
ncbi:MAG: hypothetical protein AABW83_00435 [Nanoarchaeota archaeon]